MSVEIREAQPDDAGQLAPLMRLLGHTVTVEGIAARIAALHDQDCPQLVVVEGARVLGLCGLHVMTAIQREQPVGRVTILVVDEEFRGLGLGRQLIKEAEHRLLARGCGLVEITSNLRFVEAHAFYEHLGYERTSYRFFKQI